MTISNVSRREMIGGLGGREVSAGFGKVLIRHVHRQCARSIRAKDLLFWYPALFWGLDLAPCFGQARKA